MRNARSINVNKCYFLQLHAILSCLPVGLLAAVVLISFASAVAFPSWMSLSLLFWLPFVLVVGSPFPLCVILGDVMLGSWTKHSFLNAFCAMYFQSIFTTVKNKLLLLLLPFLLFVAFVGVQNLSNYLNPRIYFTISFKCSFSFGLGGYYYKNMLYFTFEQHEKKMALSHLFPVELERDDNNVEENEHKYFICLATDWET